MDLLSMFFASSLSLSIHGVSQHYSQPRRNREYNEVNVGVGLNVDHARRFRTHFGYYRNSLDHGSFYLGASSEVCRLSVCLGGNLIAITGYTHEIVGGVLPVLSYVREDYRMNFVYVPEVRGRTPAVAFYSIEVPIRLR